MTRTVSSLIAGRTREDAPGGTPRISEPRPARRASSRPSAWPTPRPSSRPARRRGSAQRDWARVPAPVRGRAIQQLGRLVEDNAETLARILTREIGKPIAEARGSVQEVVDTCNFFVSEGRRLYGMTVPVRAPRQAAVHVPQPGRRRGDRDGGQLPGRGAVVVPRPGAPVRQHGRVEAGRVRARDLGGARAAVPARRLPRRGVQHGARGRGRRRSRGSRRRSTPASSTRSGFTGSSDVGRRIGELCGRHLQTPCLELGGKNPLVVMPDADLDLAVEGALFSGFGTAGQRCTSLGTVIVHERAHDEFLDRFAAAVETRGRSATRSRTCCTGR